MRWITLVLATALVWIPSAQTGFAAGDPDSRPTMVILHTSQGEIELEILADRVPETASAFLKYAENGFYDDAIFHRVMPNYLVGAGIFDAGFQERKPEGEPPPGDATGTLANKRGTVGMAVPAQAFAPVAEFYINMTDNPFLDSGDGVYRYHVFGRVSRGMGIVDAISRAETTEHESLQHVPVNPVVIHEVEILEE